MSQQQAYNHMQQVNHKMDRQAGSQTTWIAPQPATIMLPANIAPEIIIAITSDIV